MRFSVPCKLCTKKFKTGVSLKKHFGLKHRERNLGIVQFLDESNSPCEQPKAAALTDEEMEDYLKWLGFLWSELTDHWYRITQVNALTRNVFFILVCLDLCTYLHRTFFHQKENGAMSTAFKCHRSTLLIWFIVWETLWWTAYVMLPTSVNRFSRE